MPKTSSDELFILIQSLSKVEKANFSTYSRAKSKTDNPKSLLLFGLICKQKEYDEVKLIRQLNSIGKHHFATLKNELHLSILQSLTDYHRELDVETELIEFIHEIKIMMSKQLFDTALKLIAKAKAKGLEYEKYDYLLVLSSLELRIIKSTSSPDKLKIYRETEEERRKLYLDYLDNTAQYEALSNASWEVFLDHSHSRIKKNKNKLKQILKHPLLSSPQKARGFLSLFEFYYIHFTCSNLLEKRDNKLFALQKEWLSYLESQPQKLIERRTFFISAASRLLSIAWSLGRMKEVDYYYKRAQTFVQGLPPAKKNKFFVGNFASLTINYMHGLLLEQHAAKAIAVWEDIKRIIPQNLISQYNTITVDNNLFYSHFLLRNYREARSYLNNIISVKKDIRLDIQQQTRINLLITYYELVNLEQMSYLAKSVRNYFIKKSPVSEFDEKTLSYFERKLPTISNKKEEKSVFRLWKQELLLLPRESLFYNSDPDNLFDFFCWIDSKIENRSYAEVVKEKAKKVASY
ncbi:MAG: hypothetical protein HYU69_09875 [Bacteroidetes bacterium]|nr:hypothetical protein [Bacteroidota bacterium]